MIPLRSIVGIPLQVAGVAAEPVPEPDAERRLACLRACLGRLPADQRRLIQEVYRGNERDRIEACRRLADELGITLDVLRRRAHRVRRGLEDCQARCLAERERGGRWLMP